MFFGHITLLVRSIRIMENRSYFYCQMVGPIPCFYFKTITVVDAVLLLEF